MFDTPVVRLEHRNYDNGRFWGGGVSFELVQSPWSGAVDGFCFRPWALSGRGQGIKYHVSLIT